MGYVLDTREANILDTDGFLILDADLIARLAREAAERYGGWIPGPADLGRRAATVVSDEMGGADATTRGAILAVIARMLASVEDGCARHVAWSADQMLPDTAEDVTRHGLIWGIARRRSSRAIGTAVFTGAADAVIPAGTIIRRRDGVEYAVVEAALIGVGGTGAAAIEAVLPGAAGNADAGVDVAAGSPIRSVRADAVIGPDGAAGGADEEVDEDYRARILSRIRNPPHGGNAADYVAWALQVPGVTRAWASPREDGPGTVTVRFVTDDAEDLIPSAGAVEIVQAWIDDLKPATATVTVAAPVAQPIDFELAVYPDDADVRAAVIEELRAMILRDAAPGATIYSSRIREAISRGAGEYDHLLQAPAGDVTVAAGNIATLGTVDWLT